MFWKLRRGRTWRGRGSFMESATPVLLVAHESRNLNLEGWDFFIFFFPQGTQSTQPTKRMGRCLYLPCKQVVYSPVIMLQTSRFAGYGK